MDTLAIIVSAIAPLIVVLPMYSSSSAAELGWASLGAIAFAVMLGGAKLVVEVVRLIVGLVQSGFTWELLGMCALRIVLFGITYVIWLILNLSLLARANIDNIFKIIINILIIGSIVWFVPMLRLI